MGLSGYEPGAWPGDGSFYMAAELVTPVIILGRVYTHLAQVRSPNGRCGIYVRDGSTDGVWYSNAFRYCYPFRFPYGIPVLPDLH